MAGNDEVQSVVRTVQLLETVARHGGAAPISTLATSTGIPLATAHRLVRTLVTTGYLAQLPDRQYCLGTRLVPLGVAANSRLGHRALPVMGRMVDTLGESVNIAVLAGTQAEYIQQTEGVHSMRLFTEIGRRVPLHSTSVGKAMLSTLPDADVRAIVRRTGLPSQAPNTVRSQHALLADLAVIRERGWALDDEEMETGVRCIAAPLECEPTMALSISGPLSRMTTEAVQAAVPVLLAARDDLLRVYA